MAKVRFSLTDEVIKETKSLTSLTDEQVADILKLNENATEAVIAEKTREFYDKLDADVLELTGIEKEPSERAFDYVKRAMSTLKSGSGDAKTLKAELAALKSQKTDLEKQISEGKGNEAMQAKVTELETKLRDKDGEISDWKKKHGKDVGETKAALEAEKKRNADILIDSEFNATLAGIAFKPEDQLSKEVREAFIKEKKSSILAAHTIEFVDDGKGGQRAILRDKATGDIVKNTADVLNPFSPGEFLAKELTPIIDAGRQQSGAGTKTGQQAKGKSFVLNGAKTQVEADTAIEDHLMAQGVARGTVEFTNQHMALRKEAGVSSMPEQ